MSKRAGLGAKLIGLAIAGVAGVGGAVAWMRHKSKNVVAPGNVQEVGKSGTSWLIETTGQTYGALTALGRNVYAAPGTQYTDDSNANQIAPTYLPVLLMAQVGNDKSTRSLIQRLGPQELINRAIADLGIKTA